MSAVPSLAEQENVRLRLALEMIFREVVLNMLATSVDQAATLRWIQCHAKSIYCDKVDSGKNAAEQDAMATTRRAT